MNSVNAIGMGMLHITRLNGTIWILSPMQVSCKIIEKNRKSNLSLMSNGISVELLVKPKNFKSKSICGELETAYCGGVGRLIEIAPLQESKEEQKPLLPETKETLQKQFSEFIGKKWLNAQIMNKPIEIANIEIDLNRKTSEYYFTIKHKISTGEEIMLWGTGDKKIFLQSLIDGIQQAIGYELAMKYKSKQSEVGNEKANQAQSA